MPHSAKSIRKGILVRYAVYFKGRKIRSFNEPTSWPFVWDVGTIIRVYPYRYRVIGIRRTSASALVDPSRGDLVKVYVRRKGL
jgi:hypothetical protein